MAWSFTVLCMMNIGQRQDIMFLRGHLQEQEPESTFLEQWACEVLEFSSQYGNYKQEARSYKANSLLGPASVYPQYGDFSNSFVTRSYGSRWSLEAGRHARDGSRLLDFIDLRFERKVQPESVLIYETLNPGAVVGVWTLAPKNESDEERKWVQLFQTNYEKPCKSEGKARKLKIRLKRCPFTLDTIRLILDQTENWYYSEIDAVMLQGETVIAGDIDENSSPIQPPDSPRKIIETNHPDTGEDFLAYLPGELIEKICQYLPIRDVVNLSSTCTTLRHIITKSRAMNQLDLQPFWFNMTPSTLCVISNTFTSGLRELDLSWCGHYEGCSWLDNLHDMLQNLASKQPKMTSLRMNTTACWLKTLQVILSQFDFLELSLNYTRFFSEDDSVPLAKGIQDIMTDLDFPTSLKSLSLAGFAYPLAKLIGKLTHAVNVKNLDISNIVDGPLTPVLAEQLSKALDLTVFIAWRVPINPEGMAHFRNWKQLEYLDVGWSMNYNQDSTRDHYLELIPTMANLKFLDFSSCRSFDDNCLRSLATSCPNLEYLGLCGVSRIALEPLQDLLDQCSKLRHLDISFCHFTIADYRTLVDSYPECDICICDLVSRM